MAPSSTKISLSLPKPQTLTLSGVHAGPPVSLVRTTLTCCGGAISPGLTKLKYRAAQLSSCITIPLTV